MAGKKAYMLVMGKPNQNLLTFQRGSEWSGKYVMEFQDLVASTTVGTKVTEKVTRISFIQGGYIEGLGFTYGIYYASKTFYDQHKKRRILWSWIKETDCKKSDIKRGWASLMAVPRTVALDPTTGSNLIQWPIEELDKLRSNLNEFNEVRIEPGSLILLNVGPTSQLDILVEFELDKKASNKLRVGGGVPYNCAGRGGAGVRDALGPFGSLVLANKILTEHTPAYFYIAQVKKGELSTFFCIDQSRRIALGSFGQLRNDQKLHEHKF
ncbi:acid beta-fructofuranosidase 2, vacuolar-like protein [Tanacetum coccineum]